MHFKRFKNSKFYKKHQYRLERGNNLLSLVSALCLIMFLVGDQSYMALKRHAMSNEIKMTAVFTGFDSGIFSIDKNIIRAMAKVPRHHYVGNEYANYAYFNIALPVDHADYMIPEPFITAVMMQVLQLQKSDKVLDIGFGFGYEAAVLAELAADVHAIQHTKDSQILPKRKSLSRSNLSFHENSGKIGLAEQGPYDAILVRQSMTAPPKKLLDQLKPGGRLVIPIGMPNDIQRLTVFTREPGGITERPTLHVKITPLLKGTEI